jgi:DNA-binding LytR/AlgR family response regulator
MQDVSIIIVEDEVIVAKDIQQTLMRLGYKVPATAISRNGALEKIAEYNPNLVFMDINLKGEIDGVRIALEIKEKFDIPVIFLTSYVDKETIDRAKIAEPYGYIVKPFNETDLRTAVEIALYKFSRDHENKVNKEIYRQSLHNIDEPVIITDSDGVVNFVNDSAQSLLLPTIPHESRFFFHEAFRFDSELGQHFSFKDLVDSFEHLDNPIDGKRTWILDHESKYHVVGSRISEESGSNSGFVLVCRKLKTRQATQHEINDSIKTVENLFISNSFFVKKGSMLVRVSLDNIMWVQAMDNYVVIKTDMDQFIIHSTMKDIEIKLPTDKFIRVHRSYIIAIEKISVMDENSILISEKTIPIGKSFKENLMNKLKFL